MLMNQRPQKQSTSIRYKVNFSQLLKVLSALISECKQSLHCWRFWKTLPNMQLIIKIGTYTLSFGEFTIELTF